MSGENDKRRYTVKPKLALLFAIFPLFFTACDWDGSLYKSFDYKLQGTWATYDPASNVYTGSLVITSDRITISGYFPGQTPFWGNDDQRPFKDFLKGIALKGYSEDGHIYIEDAGIYQAGIPYIYWDDSPPPDYTRVQYLRFEFGELKQTLQRQ